MNKELLRKLKTFISSSLIVSSNLILSACDDEKAKQEESKKFVKILEPFPDIVVTKDQQDKEVNEPKAQTANVSIKKVSKTVEPSAKVKEYKQNKAVRISSTSREYLRIEEETKPEFIVLDLSLNLDFDEKYVFQERINKNRLPGIFEFEESVLNYEMETHFEWPHNENRERDTAPDGIGVKIKVGI